MTRSFQNWADGPEQPDEPLTGEQRLVCAIVRQALSDLQHAEHDAIRQQAAAFLNGSDGLRFWCEIAGLDPGTVARLAAGGRFRRRRVRDWDRRDSRLDQKSMTVLYTLENDATSQARCVQAR